MVAPYQRHAVRQHVLGAVAEGIRRSSVDDAGCQQVRQVAVPRHFAKAHHDPHPRERRHLRRKVRRTVANLLRRRFVAGRRAPHHRSDPCIEQPQPVVAMRPGRLRGKAGFEQHRIHEVARAVSREDPPRAVGSMRSRRQSKDQHLRPRIAEAGHGPSPVGLLEVRPPPNPADLLAVGAEPWAAFAGDNCILRIAQENR